MKVVFVISECESFAVMYFSTILKRAGHQVYLIFDPRLFSNDELSFSKLGQFFDMRQINIDKIKQIKPDLVGFSVYTQDYKWAVNMARKIKQQLDTKIVFGGVHCVLCPEEVLKEDCIDWVCASEGEDVILDLVENLDTEPGLLFQDELTDLETLPLPDRDLFYDQYPLFKKGLTISTSRGCPYRCSYCSSEALNELYQHKYLRQRSVDSVIGELYACMERYNPSHIHFTDDNLVLSTSWLDDFSKDYKRYIDLPFFCTCNPGTVHEEQINLLKQSGCQMVGFGMQSCNEEYRIKVLNRPGTNKHIKEITDLCHKLKLKFSFDHILGMPGDNGDMSFYRELKPAFINTFDLVYLPKTKMTQEYGRQQRTSMFSKHNRIWALLIKDIKRAMIGRWSDIFFPIQLLLTNIIKILKEKYGIRTKPICG